MICITIFKTSEKNCESEVGLPFGWGQSLSCVPLFFTWLLHCATSHRQTPCVRRSVVLIRNASIPWKLILSFLSLQWFFLCYLFFQKALEHSWALSIIFPSFVPPSLWIESFLLALFCIGCSMDLHWNSCFMGSSCYLGTESEGLTLLE